MVTLDYEKAAHLYRRAGFGAPEPVISALVGLDAGEAADRFLTFRRSKTGIAGRDGIRVARAWLKRMVTKAALQEKMTLFWHGHFATSNEKVDDLGLMKIQNGLFRAFAVGNFKALVHAVTKDPAMLLFLDGISNAVGNPNENYARELMELFTLGIVDDMGVPNYSQSDVANLARACTGIDIIRKKGVLDLARHDSGADKTFMGVTGNLGVEGVPPVDDVIEIIFSHLDTRPPQKPRVARFLARKVARFFGPANPTDTLVDAMADALVAASWEVAPMLRALFTDPEFYDPANMTSTVKSPVEYVVQPIKMLQAKTNYQALPFALIPMGQELYSPPNVAGWPGQLAWVSAGTLLARYSYARDVGRARGRELRINLGEVAGSATTAPALVQRVLHLLGPLHPPPDVVTRLEAYMNDPDPFPSTPNDVFYEKVSGLVALVIQLPQFQVH